LFLVLTATAMKHPLMLAKEVIVNIALVGDMDFLLQTAVWFAMISRSPCNLDKVAVIMQDCQGSNSSHVNTNNSLEAVVTIIKVET
jgi:hypothetical protein